MIHHIKNLYLALRPWSLPASVSPVLVGTAMAFGDGRGSGLAAGLALVTAVLIHLGTNVVNDIGDFDSGVDAANPGATFNVILEGRVPKQTMARMAAGLFAAAVVTGTSAVILQGAWILLAVGAAAILAGILYTAGPRPAAYHGMGEILVLVFFGPVAAAGTYYLQAHAVTWPALLAGTVCGLLCSGILVVNHYRDHDGDARAGKRTLAVRFGRRFAQWQYLSIFIAGAAVLAVTARVSGRPAVLIAGAAFVGAVPLIRTVFTSRQMPDLNRVVAATGKILLAFSLLFSIGWFL